MSRAAVEEAFRQAVEVSLREWGGVECGLRGAGWDGAAPLDGVAAVLPLTTTGPGFLALVLPAAQAAALTARGLRGAAPASGEWCADFLGETANVIAGQAKTLLVGTPAHYTFGTPAVAEGVGGLAAGPGQDGMWMTFESEIGPFAVRVVLPALAG
ncbi:MAG: chemotaxis protein CheX [Gemmataceae bacterium]